MRPARSARSTVIACPSVGPPPHPKPEATPVGGFGETTSEPPACAIPRKPPRSSIPHVSVWLSLGVVLAVACVVVVALPFLRRPGLSASEDRLDEPDALERRRLELAEERDRALAALKELEFDHRTAKVSDEDYRASVGPLRRRAAEALRALEPRSGTGADVEAQAGAKIHARR